MIFLIKSEITPNEKVKDVIVQKGLPLVIETIKTISSAFVTAAAEGVANSIIKNGGMPQ